MLNFNEELFLLYSIFRFIYSKLLCNIVFYTSNVTTNLSKISALTDICALHLINETIMAMKT